MKPFCKSTIRLLTGILAATLAAVNISCSCNCETCCDNEDGTRDCGPPVWIEKSECENVNNFDEIPGNCESRCID